MKIVNKILISISSEDIKGGKFSNKDIVEVADKCFYNLPELLAVSLPNVKKIGSHCFCTNHSLTSLSLPALTTAGSHCFCTNHSLTSLSLPALTTAGSDCFSYNESLTSISLPALTTARSDCFSYNASLTSINSLPALTRAGRECFSCNIVLTSLSLPALTTAGRECFCLNLVLTSLSLPALTTARIGCFGTNRLLTSLRISNKEYDVKGVDGYCFIVETQRALNGIKIYSGYNLLSVTKKVEEKFICFVAEKDCFFAHGETIKKAVSDLQFKIVSVKQRNEPINADTVITINYYRLITGACEAGVKLWIRQNNITAESIKAIDLLPILKKTSAWGGEKFKTLLTF